MVVVVVVVAADLALALAVSPLVGDVKVAEPAPSC